MFGALMTRAIVGLIAATLAVASAAAAAEYVETGVLITDQHYGLGEAETSQLPLEDGGIYKLRLWFDEPVESPGIVIAFQLYRYFVDDAGKTLFSRHTPDAEAVWRDGLHQSAELIFRMPKFQPYRTTDCNDRAPVCNVVGEWSTDTWSYVYAGIGPSNSVGYELRIEKIGVVPEPNLWALAIAGFGLAGVALRQQHQLLA